MLLVMNINSYIKWGELWSDEICIKEVNGYLDEKNENEKKIIDVISQFLNDKSVELNFDECFLDIDDNNLHFLFSETGGAKRK
jgi:hypothetical protein